MSLVVLHYVQGQAVGVQPITEIGRKGHRSRLGEIKLSKRQLHLIRLSYFVGCSLPRYICADSLGLPLPFVVNEHPPCALPLPYLHAHRCTLPASTPRSACPIIAQVQAQKYKKPYQIAPVGLICLIERAYEPPG